jgi:Mlc titration factor MtfA (ptsG expression regulator)
MKLRHPELYEELRSYYGLDPLKWFERDEGATESTAAT